MNILFVGPYRQNDGWGTAAREYLRALFKTGFNITCRPIYMNSQQTFDEFPEFDEAEKKIYSTYDVIIQNCLPHMFRKYGGVKNVGISFFETTIKYTPWPPIMNMMDEIWVSSRFEKQLLKDSNVKTDINIVHIPTDFDKYDKDYGEFEGLKDHKNEYKFYFIGELSGRKNVEALIIAFHREFHPHEPVRLVLKLNRVGMDESTLIHHVNQLITDIRRRYNFSYYKDDVIITSYLNNNELFSLHQSCDCFVMPSSGEAFCLPAFDAIMFGNNTVVNGNTGMNEFARSGSLYVDSQISPALVSDPPLPFLYNGKDTWYDINIIDLQKLMRRAYERPFGKVKEHAKKMLMPEYSYDAVAQKMRELLK